jgi:ABC-type uncharacterized transport system ATPase subunit
VFLNVDKPVIKAGEIVLKVEQLSARDSRDLPAVKNVRFDIGRNKILGVAGVDGNGQTELADVIAGLRKATGGKVSVLGKDTTNCSPLEVISMRVAYIPPDRQHTGLVLDFSLVENLLGKSYYRAPYSKRGVFQQSAIKAFANQAIQDYDVRTPGPELKAKLLSGGNQQKLVLARELSGKPDLVIAAQPTRGLDVGATEYVHHRMVEARSQGAAILLISTELEEILSLSDRIAVMFEGEIMGIISAKGADIREIGEMMAGVRRVGDLTRAKEVGEAA